jgi:hypothetical protein
LTKEKSELLGTRLKKNLLALGTTSYWYRNREKVFKNFFIKEDKLVYCSDIPGLIHHLGGAHEPYDWHLFIDLSKRSLKVVLVNTKHKLASVPVAHSLSLKESYQNLQMVLDTVL